MYPCAPFQKVRASTYLGYYPELLALYTSLNVALANSHFSFAFATDAAGTDVEGRVSGPDPRFTYGGRHDGARFHFYSARHGLFGYISALCYLVSIGLAYAWLNILAQYHSRQGHTTDPTHRLSRMSFQQWCARAWIGHRFCNDLLFPLFCSIMTADIQAVHRMPAAEMLEYIARSFFSEHYTIRGCVMEVVSALSATLPSAQVHLGVAITQVYPVRHTHRPAQVGIAVATEAGPLHLAPFDHIIFASQTTQTARILQTYMDAWTVAEHDLRTQAHLAHTEQITSALRALQYEESTVVCHSDTSILPADAALWRDLNFVSPSSKEVHAAQITMATHIVRREPRWIVMQTTNPLPWLFPRQDTWISKSTFERFVLTTQGRDTRRQFFQSSVRSPRKKYASRLEESLDRLRLGPLQGQHDKALPGIWVCGSWTYGVPLLEGCVSSARLVAKALLTSEGLSTHKIDEAMQDRLA